MLCIVMNEDVREIRFEGTRGDRFLHAKKPLKKFVPFQIPAIFSHYATAVMNVHMVKKPSLERFVVKNVDILSRKDAWYNQFHKYET